MLMPQMVGCEPAVQDNVGTWWGGGCAAMVGCTSHGTVHNRAYNQHKKINRKDGRQQCQQHMMFSNATSAIPMSVAEVAPGKICEWARGASGQELQNPKPQAQPQQQLIYHCYDSQEPGMQNVTLRIPLIMAPVLAPIAVMQDVSPGETPTEYDSRSSWSSSSQVSSSSLAEVSPTQQPPTPPAPPQPQPEPSEWGAKNVEIAVSKLKGSDTAERDSVLQEVISKAWTMARMRHGCHLVQVALDVASAPKQLTLAEAFKGHVWEALVSLHANHVLQRCIAVLPPGQVNFILEELQGRVVDAARHRFGCRVLQRLLEHCTADQTAFLVEEILGELNDLCRHLYGNYVVQHILEHGLPEQRRQVSQLIWPQMRYLARHKIGSYVVQSLFLHCPPENQHELAGSLEELTRLQRSHYGSFVAKKMKIRGGRKPGASAPFTCVQTS